MVLMITLSSKAFATNDGSIGDALIEGMQSTLVVADQAFEEYFEVQESLSGTTTEEEQQRLDDSGYPQGYDTDDPVAMGEVDPWEAYNAQQAEEIDKALLEEAQRAWQEYDDTPPDDISDHLIKP